MSISWIYLVLAILLEVFATTMMKLSSGLSLLAPTVCMFLGYILSFTFLALALKNIEISVAYAIWSAVGIVLISIIGIMFFNEQYNWVKIISTVFIIIGVAGVKLSLT